MSDRLQQDGPGWTLNTDPPDPCPVDPALIGIWRARAPFNPQARALYEFAKEQGWA